MSEGITISLITAGGAFLLGVINVASIWITNSKKKRCERDSMIVDRLDKTDAKLDNVGSGMQAMLRFDLYHLWTTCRDKGYADDMDRQNFLNLYDRYHNMGKNGVMDNVRAQFLELPTEKIKKTRKSDLKS